MRGSAKASMSGYGGYSRSGPAQRNGKTDRRKSSGGSGG